jgi:hypothetical protein
MAFSRPQNYDSLQRLVYVLRYGVVLPVEGSKGLLLAQSLSRCEINNAAGEAEC